MLQRAATGIAAGVDGNCNQGLATTLVMMRLATIHLGDPARQHAPLSCRHWLAGIRPTGASSEVVGRSSRKRVTTPVATASDAAGRRCAAVIAPSKYLTSVRQCLEYR